MKYSSTIAAAVMFVLVVSCVASAPTGRAPVGLAPDQPGEADDLNEALWASAKTEPYGAALHHISDAKSHARTPVSTALVLPNGWRIAPAGKQVEVGRFPSEAVAFGGKVIVLNVGYYSKEPQEASILDPDAGQIVKVLRLPSMFPSAQRGPAGDLYISGGDSQTIYRVNQHFDVVRAYPVRGYAAGLAAIDGSRLAVAYLVSAGSQESFDKGKYEQGQVAILNTKTGALEQELTVGYFPHTVRFINGKLYVTLLGQNELRVYTPRLEPIGRFEVGRTPQDACSDQHYLYVVNTGSDTLSVIDIEKDVLSKTIKLPNQGSGFGSGPTSCTVDGDTLYVTQASTNAVAVIDKATGKLHGSIPTGWYPTKVMAHDKRLLVLSAKGIRERRPNIDGPQPLPDKGGPQYVLTLLTGSASIIPQSQIPAQLAGWTHQVAAGGPLYGAGKGPESPVRHIFYIIRENRTYDQVLGDLGRGNGDPYLTLFGREITPNAHKLAEEFVALDNFYANGEISVLGHSFTTSGYASPFLEWLGNAAYSGRYKGYPFGMVPAMTSPAYIWDTLDANGVDYRIYGENYFLYTRAYRILRETLGAEHDVTKKFYAQMMALSAKGDRGKAFYAFAGSHYGAISTPEDASTLLENSEFRTALSTFLCADESLAAFIQQNEVLRRQFAEYLYHYPFNYHSWDLTHSDLERALEWKDDFEKQLQRGKIAGFHYIWLPNDHTGGVDKQYLPPDQLVAQNDAALGVIVETIAKSPIWQESLILVTEDDAQNGPDHVDATRTVALAIGPHVKRHTVVGDRYDQLSMLRTIEVLLHVPPLNLNDRLAVPMFSIFTKSPSITAYTPPPPSQHLAPADRELYERFEQAERRK